ncbi:MAG: hypothetical protein M1335_00970 [Chloroflexi bacterium]|nr:hypothetical protein [Chloroflexota bacterium]
MEPFDALQNIVKRDLEISFGSGLTSIILTNARVKAGIPILNMTQEHYATLVGVICDDERVIQMWGASGTKEKMSKWLRLA